VAARGPALAGLAEAELPNQALDLRLGGILSCGSRVLGARLTEGKQN
jgi:hypothetical protein